MGLVGVRAGQHGEGKEAFSNCPVQEKGKCPEGKVGRGCNVGGWEGLGLHTWGMQATSQGVGR